MIEELTLVMSQDLTQYSDEQIVACVWGQYPNIDIDPDYKNAYSDLKRKHALEAITANGEGHLVIVTASIFPLLWARLMLRSHQLRFVLRVRILESKNGLPFLQEQVYRFRYDGSRIGGREHDDFSFFEKSMSLILNYTEFLNSGKTKV